MLIYDSFLFGFLKGSTGIEVQGHFKEIHCIFPLDFYCELQSKGIHSAGEVLSKLI